MPAPYAACPTEARPALRNAALRNTALRNIRVMARRSSRRGGVTVELALTIGLAFFFFLAALEFSRVAMIRHTVDHATYEAARAGVIPGITVAQVETRARQVLGTASTRNARVEVSPNPITTSTPRISVTIGVALDQNLFAPAMFFVGRRFERTFTMERELASRP
ncbi:MAG: pilus assembly protein [Pirellulaceae bacterium]|nr:pilus assembly protein [Pirellulaceae bacterium]